ncbi:hypothetical protein [Wukongibacter baidiensis]
MGRFETDEKVIINIKQRSEKTGVKSLPMLLDLIIRKCHRLIVVYGNRKANLCLKR